MKSKQQRPGVPEKKTEPHKNNHFFKHNNLLILESQAEPPFPHFKDVVLYALMRAVGKEKIPTNHYRWRKLFWQAVAGEGVE